MNREMKRVSVLLVLMFATLFASTSVIQVFESESLAADARNRRTVLASYETQRGAILVDGRAVAESTPSDDQYRFQRVYSEPGKYSAVTGYQILFGQNTGLEEAMNAQLAGTSGTQFFDRLDSIVTGKDPQGASIALTIDPAAQDAAYAGLTESGLQGAVVALDPATGDVLALVSTPDFDPNALASHDQQAAFDAYARLDDADPSPLDNRAIAGSLNYPGSVFKLVTTSAALASGQFTPESTFPNPLTFTLPGTTTDISNAEGGNCGGGDTATLATALRLSCNIPFAELGLQLGERGIAEMASAYGFGRELEIPLAVTPSTYPRGMSPDFLAQSAFGQGDVRVTPMQVAMISAAIANDGRLMTPNLIDQVLGSDLQVLEDPQPAEFSRPIDDDVAETLTQMMVDGVADGVASNAQIEGVDVVGKTGTAQNGGSLPYTLWFTGFAPADDPRVAVAVMVEDGGGLGQSGSGNRLAAPIAKRVFEAVLGG